MKKQDTVTEPYCNSTSVLTSSLAPKDSDALEVLITDDSRTRQSTIPDAGSAIAKSLHSHTTLYRHMALFMTGCHYLLLDCHWTTEEASNIEQLLSYLASISMP